MSERRAERWEGIDEEGLARRWGASRVWLFARVGSTNDVARRLAAEGAPAGTVVLAEAQTAGRGRAGRAWVSPPGLGLWFSVTGRPAAAEALATLPLRVGLAVAQALDPFLAPPGVGIKWPNDLYLHARKLGGILCEAAWTGPRATAVVAGVGLNLLHDDADFAPEIRARATSLRLAGGADPSRLAVADQVVGAVVGVLRDPGEPLDPVALARRDVLRGVEVEVDDPMTGRALARGVAGGILGDGSLQVGGIAVRGGTVRAAEF